METGINRAKILLLLIVLSALNSCRSDIIFSAHEDFGHDGWSRYNAAIFHSPVTDTVSSAEVDITIRTGSNYPYRNLYLFVTTIAPSGVIVVDTLEYMLANEKGIRMGKGTGDVRELNLSLRKNVYFPVAGTYSFRIEHGMRTEILEGVYDVGLRIRKNTGNKR